MAEINVAPYGSWHSPLTSDVIVAQTIGLGQLALDGDDIYWTEGRPAEGGRQVLVRCTPDGSIEDLIPAPFNARTRVHEYGGGSFWVDRGTVYFANFDDQRLYQLRPGSEPTPITPDVSLRYADGIVDRARSRIICVREDHTTAGAEPLNTIASLDLGGDGEGRVLVMGNDFYASPRLSPDGSQLAWLAWDHPNMPWDGTELWVGELDADGTVINKTLVAGGENESIFQPQWSPDGVLYFVSDRTGWWNLCRWRDGDVDLLHEREAEFGVPQWRFGRSTYGFTADGALICLFYEGGRWHLATVQPDTGQLKEITTPYTEMEGLRVGADFVVLEAASPTEMPAFVRIDLATQQIEVLRRAGSLDVDAGYLSVPEAMTFPTENGLTAHAFFYPPQNKEYRAPAGELPPLLVESHGGPTSHSGAELNPKIQYWTSRGIAVLDVNYGGSTGYGRAYRERLDGEWGVVDVEDCINGARYLVTHGRVDGERLAIRGGSAGGYTTLCALTFHDFFATGASYFGVSDPAGLAEETHKFESRYLDQLIGPYPERKDLYRARSPLHHADALSRPVIFFQGEEDKVVLPSQAEKMVDALKEKGIPVAYLLFTGEQHGFRRAENIKRALDAELYFYGRIFGFTPADEIEPVPIDNLE